MTDKKESSVDIGGAVIEAAVKAGLVDKLISGIIGALTGLFGRRKDKPTPPAVSPTKPIPAPTDDDEFPDDHIPRPVGKRKVAKVTIHLARAQYSRERFPQEYTAENPFGLVPDDYLRKIEKGAGALAWGSKFWLDLTAYDEDGHEFLRPDVLAYDLAYRTEHRCGDAFIKGHGLDPATGGPVAGYETNDTEEIGNGISAWGTKERPSSLGFLHQMQAFAAADGKEFEVSGSVNGVQAKGFTLKVS